MFVCMSLNMFVCAPLFLCINLCLYMYVPTFVYMLLYVCNYIHGRLMDVILRLRYLGK